MKVYSGFDELPAGTAPGPVTPGCMVLEGGAFRGVYTQGALDALMQYGVNLQCTIGVSAGALSGMNYMSRQIGRSARVNLGQRHNGAYVGAQAVVQAHSIIRLDYLFDDYNEIEPLDVTHFYDPERRYVAVATSCLDGTPQYFEQANCPDMMSAIKASASMPFVSPAVNVNGVLCLDGGCSCKIPYQWALDQDFEKIVIIKTREQGYRKKVSNGHPASLVYRDYPEFAEAFDDSSAMYNRQCDEIDQLEAEGRAFVLAPSEPVEVARVEGDMEKLGHLYLLGYYDALVNLLDLCDYLGCKPLVPES